MIIAFFHLNISFSASHDFIQCNKIVGHSYGENVKFLATYLSTWYVVDLACLDAPKNLVSRCIMVESPLARRT